MIARHNSIMRAGPEAQLAQGFVPADVCAMNKTLVEIIADGLDASVDGRGYNVEHHRAVTLANAAPALLEALREAWEIAADHRRPMFDQLVKWEILLTGLSRRDDENQLMLNVEGGGR